MKTQLFLLHSFSAVYARPRKHQAVGTNRIRRLKNPPIIVKTSEGYMEVSILVLQKLASTVEHGATISFEASVFRLFSCGGMVPQDTIAFTITVTVSPNHLTTMETYEY